MAMFKKGYTFLEVIVTCTIIGIMAGIVIVSFSSRRTEKELETAANEVVAAIREAQNNAVTGRNVTQSCNQNSYSFKYDVSGGVYTVGSVASGCSYARYTLKNSVKFKNSGSLSFTVPFGITGGGTIKLEKGSYSYCVFVNSSQIYAQKTGC